MGRAKTSLCITAAASAVVFLGAVTPPAHAAAESTVQTQASMACYLYVSSFRGYYNVRENKDPRAGLIVRYEGRRLPVWDRCGSVVGRKYRCEQGEPQDDSWIAVNYLGRKGWVAAECAGGLGS
ncbi:hypothetical protein ACFV7Q_27030 [Streptomyces sp. NPDC059851]|uniref:hypothetical protein n=1 Tax=Streptomyces sp. NPDC059851 TaxID=3346971 RepID=UPI003648930E